MILPEAPRKYNLRDQDQIRRMLDRGIDDFFRRLAALEAAPVTPPPPPGDGLVLPVGVTGNSDLIGLGPGETTGPHNPALPKYGVIGQYIATTANIVDEINAAEAAGVIILVTLARGRSVWTIDGVYHHDLYLADIDRFDDRSGSGVIHAAIQAAVDRQGIAFMLYDEVQHEDFQGVPPNGQSTITPTHVNDAGLYHKNIWPGAITFVRSPSSVLVSGWSNIDGESVPPAGGWTGLDYGVGQYIFNGARTTFPHPWDWFDNEKTRLATVDLGLLPFINYWNGGLWQDLDVGTGGGPAVSMCWDHLNNGTSNGIIVGSRSGLLPAPLAHIECDDSDPNWANVGSDGDHRLYVANPELMETVVQWAANDPDSPVFSGFVDAREGGPVDDPDAVTLWNRSDMVAARRNMIGIGLARTNGTGWRTIK